MSENKKRKMVKVDLSKAKVNNEKVQEMKNDLSAFWKIYDNSCYNIYY